MNFYEIIHHLEGMDKRINDLEHEIYEALNANLDIIESRLKNLQEIVCFKMPQDMPNKEYRMLGFLEYYEIGDEAFFDDKWNVITHVGEDNGVFMGSFSYRRRI